ncbi:hypothetical protein ONZ45_g19040 [Pleurotus djamor]|nr:hypothetical protein ONZ45_g19040 [Pleurotus djamor]
MTPLAIFFEALPPVEEVDRRIESLKDEIRKLQYYRNAQHSTISRLPTEIWANIFEILVLSEGVPRHGLHTFNPLRDCLVITHLKAPILKEASFLMDHSRIPTSKVTFLSVERSGPPLQCISLRNVPLDLRSPALLGLKTLKIIDPHSNFKTSPQEMISALEPLKYLKHLTLTRAMAGSTKSLGRTVIDMPSLLTLRLTISEPSTLGVLNHISSPSLRSLVLTVEVVSNAETLLPLRATLAKMIPQIKSPYIRIDVTHSGSEFLSSLNIWPHVDKRSKGEAPIKVVISSHPDYSTSHTLFSLLPDSIPTSLGLSSKHPNMFIRGDSAIPLRRFLRSLPPSVVALRTRNHLHLVAFLSDTPRLRDLRNPNDTPVFSLPSLKRILLEEDKGTNQAFRLSDEYTRFEEILKARKALSAGIETLTIKSNPAFFWSMYGEPLLEFVKTLNVVHYESRG